MTGRPFRLKRLFKIVQSKLAGGGLGTTKGKKDEILRIRCVNSGNQRTETFFFLGSFTPDSSADSKKG
jgi:hypothetical protein